MIAAAAAYDYCRYRRVLGTTVIDNTIGETRQSNDQPSERRAGAPLPTAASVSHRLNSLNDHCNATL